MLSQNMKATLVIASGAFLIAGSSTIISPEGSPPRTGVMQSIGVPFPRLFHPLEKPAEMARHEAPPPLPAPAPPPPAPAPPPPPPPPPAPANNLDGWIKQAQGALARNGIPVPSYHGIHRNVIRESSGNPRAVNNWDINAINGTPSKGLLQTIDPTFNAYHVPGTSRDPFDPVANIAAACNYAWNRYGGMDNVNGAY